MKGLIVLMALIVGAVHVEYNVRIGDHSDRRYKAVHQMTGEKLIINWFSRVPIYGEPYRFEGTEIFEGGAKVKDTFEAND